jgi:hypothetical protein
MAVVTLANFPDELYQRLVRRAAENRRRLDDEIVEAAQRFLGDAAPSLSAEKLRLADAVRDQTKGAWITDDVIRRARDEGRA